MEKKRSADEGKSEEEKRAAGETGGEGALGKLARAMGSAAAAAQSRVRGDRPGAARPDLPPHLHSIFNIVCSHKTKRVQ